MSTQNTTAPEGNYVVYHNGPANQVMAVENTRDNRLTAGLHYPVTIVFAETAEDALAAAKQDKDFAEKVDVKKAEADRKALKHENKIDGLNKMTRRLNF